MENSLFDSLATIEQISNSFIYSKLTEKEKVLFYVFMNFFTVTFTWFILQTTFYAIYVYIYITYEIYNIIFHFIQYTHNASLIWHYLVLVTTVWISKNQVRSIVFKCIFIVLTNLHNVLLNKQILYVMLECLLAVTVHNLVETLICFQFC